MTIYKLKIGSRAQVMHGTAKITGGGLTKKQLKYNKRGKIVSRKASRTAKKANKLVKAGYITKKGVFGIIKGGSIKILNTEPKQVIVLKKLNSGFSIYKRNYERNYPNLKLLELNNLLSEKIHQKLRINLIRFIEGLSLLESNSLKRIRIINWKAKVIKKSPEFVISREYYDPKKTWRLMLIPLNKILFSQSYISTTYPELLEKIQIIRTENKNLIAGFFGKKKELFKGIIKLRNFRALYRNYPEFIEVIEYDNINNNTGNYKYYVSMNNRRLYAVFNKIINIILTLNIKNVEGNILENIKLSDYYLPCVVYRSDSKIKNHFISKRNNNNEKTFNNFLKNRYNQIYNLFDTYKVFGNMRIPIKEKFRNRKKRFNLENNIGPIEKYLFKLKHGYNNNVSSRNIGLKIFKEKISEGTIIEIDNYDFFSDGEYGYLDDDKFEEKFENFNEFCIRYISKI